MERMWPFIQATRAKELALLRRRLAAEPGALEGPPEEAALAAQLRGLREQLIRELGEVESCRGCALGHPLPAGRWAGGHCCGGVTAELFSDDEVAALRMSGTKPRSLTPPRADHAGCAFRGPTGCSLPGGDRPNVCVRHLCRQLLHEVRQRDNFSRIRELCVQLDEAFATFVALRAGRLEEAELARLQLLHVPERDSG